jgi:uncharacterized protein (TIGR02246 family)
MRKYLPVIFLLLFAASTFAGQSGMNPAGEAFVKAVNAQDADGIAVLYDADSVLFPPDTMVLKGHDAIRQSWVELFKTYTTHIEVSNGSFEIKGDLSYSWGNFTMTLTPKAGGEPMKIEGRYSDVSKMVNGKWYYIVDHASVPLPPPPQTMQH